MATRYLAAAAVAAATLLAAVPSPASAAPAQPLKLRSGLTLYIPITWRVHGAGTDAVQVVTGRCGRPKGWGTPECDAFYVFGPSYIKRGAEGFGPYTGKRPFYTASDVQPCPSNRKWGEIVGPKVQRGLRQVGKGHKAAYNAWRSTCVSFSESGRVRARFTQREWYLPQSRILVVDQWNTPGLAGVLKHADWR
ncbi:hypothetical protein FH608_029505 [Nonomuraea phyllanthi]|uniref:Uncharacterized protein n=1 Tax=Nonomuraea phyllanthi TaxID=2219224 RepID=A0A5C4W3Q5_9ACTN|nr:hypothetical protein [Nonomuraea phyllanthi]KAB8191403.1 hypothetical protein FH608_029505 [Nonomuraea phyllanthi]